MISLIVVIFCAMLLLWRVASENEQILSSLLYKARKFISLSKPTKTSPRLVNKYNIKPLLSFDITKVDPVDYKPYKTQGHVTMGIQKRTRDEWIRMDRGYLARIEERRPLIRDKAEYTIGTGPLVNDAIAELYEEIMIYYLPHRYPTIFKPEPAGSKNFGDNSKSGVMMIRNVLTGSTYPLSTAGLLPEDMLRLLGLNVEEDFYIMCPDDDSDGAFRLQGYIACFPGGFLSPEARGKTVREIHAPVPGYEERLGRSVDRYFSRMQPGQFIGRMNWSLQLDGPDLFRTSGNNYYPNSLSPSPSSSLRTPDLSQAYLRVEHQTLCALPRSRAIVFCVRSYMTPLSTLRAQDGGAEGRALAAAIESMPARLGEYKMRCFWGAAVLPWLKGETEGVERDGAEEKSSGI